MPLTTPDGRYIIVRGRLWRASDPDLPDAERQRLTRELMAARRAVRVAKAENDSHALEQARKRVHQAKVSLGERGEVWWQDGAPDYNRCLVKNTPYADWYQGVESKPGGATRPASTGN